ncbi:hypothetical protein Q8W37_17010 [Shimia thalassica]|uniref:hypothetical protein n=1 Tax=Shimia thalassica TaxID=1715693 RepID=UPI001F21FCDF|nr:hypothetical protein [Shimia thalassica]MDO6480232.1 hypothetical protein [Shimia thalassica]MDO6483294.1 hypothetical protein [Shimia thalassica]MDO6503623.1 hypothetical protein [Shimia thalassica]MDO6520970.1 hypothetical protein [Shimia thalassica]MDO6798471.1 hypothetical protein [Shimia thalassica]
MTGFLAISFWRNPEAGMAAATHRPEKLPLVMIDRYIAFTFLAVAAALYGDPLVITVLFVAFAFMGLADGVIYARAGHPHIKHTAAGLASLCVAGVALLTESLNGAA